MEENKVGRMIRDQVREVPEGQDVWGLLGVVKTLACMINGWGAIGEVEQRGNLT